MCAFEHIQVPPQGSAITVDTDGRLVVPDNPIVAYIEGATAFTTILQLRNDKTRREIIVKI